MKTLKLLTLSRKDLRQLRKGLPLEIIENEHTLLRVQTTRNKKEVTQTVQVTFAGR